MNNELATMVPSAARWQVDPQSVLDLNQIEVIATSPLNPDQLERLLVQSFYVHGIDAGRLGFLIALDQTADYQSPNFQWFVQRLPRFVYIDRVVVAAAGRGQGFARVMYQALAEAARQAGHTVLVCEVNQDPPNPASDAFHASLGFRELGSGSPSVGKRVSYLVLDL